MLVLFIKYFFRIVNYIRASLWISSIVLGLPPTNSPVCYTAVVLYLDNVSTMLAITFVALFVYVPIWHFMVQFLVPFKHMAIREIMAYF